MVPLQETPPAGWPHTEAHKHHTSLHAAPPPEGRPPAPKTAKNRGGCCVGTLFLLLVAAVAVVVGVAVLLGAFGDDTDTATQTFLDAHPGWQVESSEVLGEADGPVRLVAWDSARNIGRLVTMQPDTLAESGWSEVSLIVAMPGDTGAEDAFLDEFGSTFSSTRWSYATVVEAADIVSNPQTWRVWYRVWDEDAETWSVELETWATRDRDSAEWIVGEPGTDLDAEEGTPTP